MIFTFEICTTKEETKVNSGKFFGRFKGFWDGKRCWRVWFWKFSIVYFPSSDMKKFMDTCKQAFWFSKSVRK